MTIRIATVGKIREKDMSDYESDLARRISSFAKMEDLPARNEKELLDKTLATKTKLFVLDRRGRELDSREFSLLLNTDATFVIGPSEGFSDKGFNDLKARGDVLSFSRMTLPHRLCKIFLVEQIYRGFCLQKGLPYAK